MNENRLLCLGYGYVARRLAARLKAEGWTASGTIRDAAAADRAAADGVAPVSWSDEKALGDAIQNADALLISTPPSSDGCPSAAIAARALAARRRPRIWIGYLSTNGVYGDHQGAWVDETSPLLATSPRAKYRIAAENQWRALGGALDIPVVIFRLPGIYGPGRSALDTVREGRAQRIYKEGQIFSRAHVDDIAAALQASIAAALMASVAAPDAGDIFNIADDEPAPPQDVIAYACALLGVGPPPLVPIEQAQLSAMAKSFYADNKRVSNRLMKERLLPALSYPTYREGLKAILAAERLIPVPD